MLSRATQSLNDQKKTAQVEKYMAESWVLEVLKEDSDHICDPYNDFILGEAEGGHEFEDGSKWKEFG